MKRDTRWGMRKVNVGLFQVVQSVSLELRTQNEQLKLIVTSEGFEKTYDLQRDFTFKPNGYSEKLIVSSLFRARIITYRNSEICVIDESIQRRLKESKMIYYFLSRNAWAEVFITKVNSYTRKVFTILYDNSGIKQGIIYADNEAKREVGNEEALGFSRLSV